MVKRNKMITFRVTEWEYKQLLMALQITGNSRSNFLAMAMLEKCQKVNRGK